MKKHILVVDDDKDIRELITVYLKSEDFYVDKACNGEEALKFIEENHYDLVLLDIMMPKMDGIETLINLRKKYMMPVIFLTAKDQEIDLLKGLSLGADDYISKPFSSLELIARVKAQLRRYTVFNNLDKSNITIGELVLDSEIDVKLLSRVFENILKNAEKYSDSNSVFKISVESNETYIVMHFKNKCDGIDEIDVNKIFERFYRLDSARSSEKEGSGLGLTISKRIIELHHGIMEAEKQGDNLILTIKLYKV